MQTPPLVGNFNTSLSEDINLEENVSVYKSQTTQLTNDLKMYRTESNNLWIGTFS